MALGEIGVMWDYRPPPAKVKYGEGHLGANLEVQGIQIKATLVGRSGLLLMVLASDAGCTVATTPLVPHARHCQQGCPSLPCPFSPRRGPALLHSVILRLLWPGPAFCLATLHLKESEAAEMCTADGRNYLAHLTSEIFFFFFLLSPSFPPPSIFHKLLQDWGNW